jgi:hypothetical protein
MSILPLEERPGLAGIAEVSPELAKARDPEPLLQGSSHTAREILWRYARLSILDEDWQRIRGRTLLNGIDAAAVVPAPPDSAPAFWRAC